MALFATTEIKSSSTANNLSSKHRQSQQQKKPITGSTPSTPFKVHGANINAATVTPSSTQNPVRVDLTGEEENASASRGRMEGAIA